MKANKQQYIDFIVSELENSNVLYKDVCNVFLRKFACTRQTFDKYWKIANESYKEAQQAIKEAKEVQTITNEIDRLKTLNLTKIDRMRIAESIAMNTEMNSTPSEQLKALDYLSKIEGDYAPTKTAQTDTEGNDLPNVTINGK
jgi:hypothetical protein